MVSKQFHFLMLSFRRPQAILKSTRYSIIFHLICFCWFSFNKSTKVSKSGKKGNTGRKYLCQKRYPQKWTKCQSNSSNLPMLSLIVHWFWFILNLDDHEKMKRNVNNVHYSISYYTKYVLTEINCFPDKVNVSLSKRCHFLHINDVRLRKQVQLLILLSQPA